jgi:hypothetical protein
MKFTWEALFAGEPENTSGGPKEQLSLIFHWACSMIVVAARDNFPEKAR